MLLPKKNKVLLQRIGRRAIIEGATVPPFASAGIFSSLSYIIIARHSFCNAVVRVGVDGVSVC